MFTVTGKLSNKAVLKTGVNEHGSWKVLNFCLEKTRKRKPIKIPFTAKGALAEKINQIALGEKVVITFFIEGKKYKDKYFTDCIVTEVEKYVKKAKYGQVTYGDKTYNDAEYEFQKESSLFNQGDVA